ncbi:hypothetical protein P3T76_012998 [Phytophthora citrophthora]|uniref:Uncharacterized protein n=1 Tax=Phytophthora citrophthora TaxID=4793 RepID=A0AAD9G406_9STRA|nr:hypothetical protein P3T76_012998 [Phytophthora citrophthora]
MAVAAATSFPRGKKPKASGQKVAAPSASASAPGEALFGKRGLAAVSAAEEQPKKKAKKTVKPVKNEAKDELKAAKATLLSFKTLRKGMLLRAACGR